MVSGIIRFESKRGISSSVNIRASPKERIVARVAGDELGALITKPFVLEGKKLEINANSLKDCQDIMV